MSFTNLTSGEVKVIKSHELESENIELRKRIEELQLMVAAYESAHKFSGTPEDLDERISIVYNIFHPENRIGGHIWANLDDIGWLDKKLQDIVIEDSKNTSPCEED